MAKKKEIKPTVVKTSCWVISGNGRGGVCIKRITASTDDDEYKDGGFEDVDDYLNSLVEDETGDAEQHFLFASRLSEEEFADLKNQVAALIESEPLSDSGPQRDEFGNVPRLPGFEQVCIIHGLVFESKEDIDEFVQFILDKTGTRVQYLEQVKTLPGDGGEGGRNDVLFAVHNDDVAKFAVPRFQLGARWIEDTLSKVNYRDPIYPERIFKYRLHDEW